MAEQDRWQQQLENVKRHLEARKKAQIKREKEMAISISGKDYQGGGSFVTPDPGTYPCTLVGAKMYKNENFDKDKLLNQIGLVWDTGLVVENDDGKEVDLLIFDDWLTFSLNEKANLTKRFKALADFDERTADLDIEFENDNVTTLDQLQHWREHKEPITMLKLNGENLFGKQALVSVELNASGYAKVTGVSKPMAQASGKVKARNTAPPAGAPL